MTDPIACPKCGSHWDFRTDYLGRLVAVHSTAPCIPRPSGFYVECSVCEAPMRLEADPGRRTLFWCSAVCHKRLMALHREMRAEASRKYLQKQAMSVAQFVAVTALTIVVDFGLARMVS